MSSPYRPTKLAPAFSESPIWRIEHSILVYTPPVAVSPEQKRRDGTPDDQDKQTKSHHSVSFGKNCTYEK